ncbi:hypothetical protein CSV61_08895 [Sporosarcina sp. P3]|uniref:hypothetical protein n=1 Tax=Sporosarcina TaxID=1569 RepID=UPI0009DC5B44|nr:MULTISPECIES: hypothetical protein [Sporosarcina]ARF16146.1 hypothetical protein SporoP17a_01800 [Sporosarcina ureae]PID21341.1 hypothetical protein CSV61_08895 [Sporosarcina sp. P3]
MNGNSIPVTFEDIYKLLVQFSNQIEEVRKTSYNLTLNLSYSLPDPWNQFIDFFDLGGYYHHRCQGYVECLRITYAYSQRSIEIWIHELVNPAASNFMNAMQLMNDIKEIPEFQGSAQLSNLEHQMNDFQKTAMMILQYSNNLDSMFLRGC